MKIRFALLTFLSFLLVNFVSAKEYNASLFGIKSNGTTLNTTSIQKAIDFIHEQGGGTLRFFVGRYLTGTIILKENVHIKLEEGAILVGSTNIYDYNIETPNCALVYANKANNISIRGKGVIDGQGRDLAYNLLGQIHSGIIKDPLDYDRPRNRRPKAIYFRECENVAIHSITIKNAADWVQVYDQCVNTVVDSITVDSKAFWNNDGIDIVDCKNFKLLNSFIDAADDAICLKSHDATKRCENIEIRNCVGRSSANGIKFGTVSAGGYKNVRIINNKIYDTFRSVFTIATPDGGIVEDIVVDSLQGINVGNPFYLRIGARWNKGRKGAIRNILIQNVKVEVSKNKPDIGYDYEGPVEDYPRNISPSGIVGLKNVPISDVTFRNVELVYPGDANPHYAYRGITKAALDSIPEMESSYPEFSQFKELPAWGFFVRHAKNIKFENVTLTLKESDYRPAFVFDDVQGFNLDGVKYLGTKTKKEVVANNSKREK